MERIKDENLPSEQFKFYNLEQFKKYTWWEKKILYGGKSPLVNIKFLDGRGLEHTLACKFRLAKNKEGNFDVRIEHVQNYLNLKKPFWGYEFTPEQQEKLFKEKELGEIVMLNVVDRQIPSLVGIDTDLNTLAFIPLDAIYIPNQVKGCTISEFEKFVLRRGGEIYKENFQFDKDKPELSARIMNFSARADKISFRVPTPERLALILEKNEAFTESYKNYTQNQKITKNIQNADLLQTKKPKKNRRQKI